MLLFLPWIQFYHILPQVTGWEYLCLKEWQEYYSIFWWLPVKNWHPVRNSCFSFTHCWPRSAQKVSLMFPLRCSLVEQHETSCRIWIASPVCLHACATLTHQQYRWSKLSHNAERGLFVYIDIAASVFRQKVWIESAFERSSERHSQLNETQSTQHQTASALPAGSQGLLYQLWVTLNYKIH